MINEYGTLGTHVDFAKSEREARLLLARYLAGLVPVEFVVAVFGGLSWNLAQADRVPAGLKRLVEDAQLAIDEYTGGHRAELELQRLLLAALTRTYTYDVAPTMVQIRSGSVSSSTEISLAVRA